MLQYKKGMIINQTPVHHTRHAQKRVVLYSVVGHSIPPLALESSGISQEAGRTRRFKRGLMLI